MERLTFVDEKGNVLFTPKNYSEDVGYTIIQLVEGGHIDLLNEIANRLANYEQRLKLFEDLEEQGLLPKLPCCIGSDVYFIPSKVSFDLNKLNRHEESNRVYHQKVAKIVFTERGWYLECDRDLEYGTGHILVDKLYKETWFLTQAEAEETLKKMTEAAGTKEIISGKEKK